MSRLCSLVLGLCIGLAAAATSIPPPSGAPTTITVQFVIRDVVGNGATGANKTTHIDFERVIA
ncbi:hypothetical protein ABTF05_22595, partial [Acinetobacter baumannii]